MTAEEKFKYYGIVDGEIEAVVMQAKENKDDITYTIPIITSLRCQLKKRSGKKTLAIELPDNSIIVMDEAQILKTLNQC